jgi:hypothetical protein
MPNAVLGAPDAAGDETPLRAVARFVAAETEKQYLLAGRVVDAEGRSMATSFSYGPTMGGRSKWNSLLGSIAPLSDACWIAHPLLTCSSSLASCHAPVLGT